MALPEHCVRHRSTSIAGAIDPAHAGNGTVRETGLAARW
jgi:hypothetical protein